MFGSILNIFINIILFINLSGSFRPIGDSGQAPLERGNTPAATRHTRGRRHLGHRPRGAPPSPRQPHRRRHRRHAADDVTSTGSHDVTSAGSRGGKFRDDVEGGICGVGAQEPAGGKSGVEAEAKSEVFYC